MQSKLSKFYMYLFLSFLAGIILVPLYLTFISSFKTLGDLSSNVIGLPREWIFSNYTDVFGMEYFWSFAWNSLVYGVLTTVLTLICASMAAFVFAHIRFFWNRFLFNYFILGLTFPFATAILPLFLRVRDLGLLGSVWAVILPQIAFGLAFAIILFRGFFRQMPSELFDAAFVDGCTYSQFYFRFTLPLSTPIIATVAVINLVGSWNNYLLPLIMINSESLYSWPLGIMVFRGEYITDWPKILAFVSLTLIPAVVFFLALQRFIVAGLTGGAVKE